MSSAGSTSPRPTRQRGRHLTFVFVGAGYAGVEALAEMRQLVQDALPHYPSLRDVASDGSSSMLVLGFWPRCPERLADYTSGLLQRSGVEILTSSTLAAVEEAAVTLASGRRIDTATVVWTAGVRANPLVRTLALPLDERGRIVSTPRSGSQDARTSGLWVTARVPNAATPGGRSAHLSARCPAGARLRRSLVGDLALRLPQHRRGAPRSGAAGASPASSASTSAAGSARWSPARTTSVRYRSFATAADPCRRPAVHGAPARHR